MRGNLDVVGRVLDRALQAVLRLSHKSSNVVQRRIKAALELAENFCLDRALGDG